MKSFILLKKKGLQIDLEGLEGKVKVVKVMEVEKFFSFETYLVIKEAFEESIPVFGAFIDIEKEYLQLFLTKALQSFSVRGGGHNLYYYPKPHPYFQSDNVGLFFLWKQITLEKFMLEILYRNAEVSMVVRNKLHGILESKLGFKKRRITLEGRELSNLSSSWVLFENVPMHQVHLLERTKDFYPAPIHINLGTTNSCNLRCSFCHYFSPVYTQTHTTDFFKDKKLLDEKIVYAVMDYAAKYNCIIDMVSPGEMLMDKRVPDFIKYGKEKGVRYISMTTNGLLLDEEMGNRLIESHLDALSISIDAVEENTYKEVRGGDFKKLINNVESFLKKLEGEGSSMYITLSLILQGNAKGEAEAFKEKWSKYHCVKELYIRNLVVKEENGMKVTHEKNFNVESRMLCQKPWDEIHIHPDGGVVPCCTISGAVGWDDKVLGNLYEQSLEEIWHGDIAYKMRRDLMGLDFSYWKVCDKCEEWSYISVEHENGDIESPCIDFVKVN